ncbi:MAG: nucleotidyltransferase family protein [Calditrichaeota bacterium]|nr:MAG: nucleotidyltransferase family protein [Calditrichota bacterium]
MRAILLCAGYGTRMYPLTRNYPKPLLEIGGKPVLDYLMQEIVDFPRLQDIHVVTNARFMAHFQAWQQKWQPQARIRKKRLHLHNDGSTQPSNRLGAIADLALVLRTFKRQVPTLVAAGDNIFRFSLLEVWQPFLQSGKNLVIALREENEEKLKRTGVLQLDAENRVVHFQEKPQHPASHWMCPAIYFLQPRALRRVEDYLAGAQSKDAPGHFLAFLVHQEPVYAVKVAGTRLDIGSIEEYHQAQRILASSEPGS